MSNFLASAAQWLADKQKAYVSETVTYTRPGTGSVSGIQATIGRTAFRTSNDGPSRLEWVDADFLIEAADLVIGGVAITPQKGDTITPTTGNLVGHVYQVQATPGEQHARSSDQFGIRLRIHGKRTL